MPDSLPKHEKKRIKKAYASKIENEINPVYRKIVSFLKNEYLPNSRDSYGYGELPGGEEWYKFLVKYYTSTNISADEIYEIGMKQIEQTHAEMNKIKDEVGFEGDLKAFFEFLRTDKQFYFAKPENENPNIPKFRNIGFLYLAYNEGWALYSEDLGKSLGLYTDSYSYFGHLAEDLWRSVRLVVDVGIHIKRLDSRRSN